MERSTPFGRLLKHGVYVGLLAYIAFALTNRSYVPCIETHDETSSVVSEDMPWMLPPKHTQKRPLVIGTLKSAERAALLLTQTGIKIRDWGERALQGVYYTPIPRVVFFTTVTVKELGFPRGATRAAIYAAAEERGLSVCPAEVGVQLWLSYPELFQSGEWALVASEPVMDMTGKLLLFDLIHHPHSTIRSLDASTGEFRERWPDYRRWVFCVERPETQA